MSELEPKREKPGPDPERLKIDEEDWEDAVKKALEKRKPKEDWPGHCDENDTGEDE